MSKVGQKVFSGKEVVEILVKYFGFVVVKQKGSHVKCRKEINGKKITTIVPQHKKLSPGTFASALNLAKINKEEFLIVVNRK